MNPIENVWNDVDMRVRKPFLAGNIEVGRIGGKDVRILRAEVPTKMALGQERTGRCCCRW